MKQFLLAAGLLMLASASYGQTATSRVLSVPLAGKVVLRDIQDKYNAQVVSFEAPEPESGLDEEQFEEMKREVGQRFPRQRSNPLPGKYAKTAAAPPPPIVQRGFVPDSMTAIPPDNYMAVGKGSFGVNVQNGTIAVVDPANGNISMRKGLLAFTLATGIGTSSVYSRYDPKVLYDPEADRYFFVTLAGTNQYNYIIVGFSKNNDPTDEWNLYTFYGDYKSDTTWFDYPTISMTHSDVFLTGNKLVYNGSFQTGFRQSVIYQMRKSDGYAGRALTFKLWDGINYNGATIRNIFPVKGGGSIKGPEQYFLSVRNVASIQDSVFLLKISDSVGSTFSNLSIVGTRSNLQYGFPPNGRQPNVKDVLQTNDARVLGAFIEGNEIQFVSNTVQPSTGANAIYHGIMTNYTGAPSVSAKYITVDTMDFAYPNISYTGMNAGKVTSIVSFDYSGPKHFPGVAAVFWDGNDHSALLEVKKGDSIIKMLTDTVQRWGDYTGSQPRWNAIGQVWNVGLYGRRDRTYGVWMSLLRSPYAVGVQEPAGSNTTPATAFPNPAMRYISLRFTLKEEARLRFEIYNAVGARVDQVLETKCERGRNEIQFNTASLAPGQYLLQGTGTDGQVLVKERFIKE